MKTRTLFHVSLVLILAGCSSPPERTAVPDFAEAIDLQEQRQIMTEAAALLKRPPQFAKAIQLDPETELFRFAWFTPPDYLHYPCLILKRSGHASFFGPGIEAQLDASDMKGISSALDNLSRHTVEPIPVPTNGQTRVALVFLTHNNRICSFDFVDSVPEHYLKPVQTVASRLAVTTLEMDRMLWREKVKRQDMLTKLKQVLASLEEKKESTQQRPEPYKK